MNIIKAYEYLMKGYFIKRKDWDYWSRLGIKEDNTGFVERIGMLVDVDGRSMTMISSQDVLANDWEIKKEND